MTTIVLAPALSVRSPLSVETNGVPVTADDTRTGEPNIRAAVSATDRGTYLATFFGTARDEKEVDVARVRTHSELRSATPVEMTQMVDGFLQQVEESELVREGLDTNKESRELLAYVKRLAAPLSAEARSAGGAVAANAPLPGRNGETAVRLGSSFEDAKQLLFDRWDASISAGGQKLYEQAEALKAKYLAAMTEETRKQLARDPDALDQLVDEKVMQAQNPGFNFARDSYEGDPGTDEGAIPSIANHSLNGEGNGVLRIAGEEDASMPTTSTQQGIAEMGSVYDTVNQLTGGRGAAGGFIDGTAFLDAFRKGQIATAGLVLDSEFRSNVGDDLSRTASYVWNNKTETLANVRSNIAYFLGTAGSKEWSALAGGSVNPSLGIGSIFGVGSIFSHFGRGPRFLGERPSIPPDFNVDDRIDTVTIGGLDIPRINTHMIGAFLGRGKNKDVYEYGQNEAIGLSANRPIYPEHDPRILVLDYSLPEFSGVPMLNHLQTRNRDLRELEGSGLPTVHTRGPVLVTKEGRLIKRSYPAVIYSERYPLGSGDLLIDAKLGTYGTSPLLNQNTIEDLLSIRAKLDQQGIVIGNFKGMIDQDGHFFLSAPSALFHRPKERFAVGSLREDLYGLQNAHIDGLLTAARRSIIEFGEPDLSQVTGKSQVVQGAALPTATHAPPTELAEPSPLPGTTDAPSFLSADPAYFAQVVRARREAGLTREFIELVGAIQREYLIPAPTPLLHNNELDRAVQNLVGREQPIKFFLKDETQNVAGSFKARVATEIYDWVEGSIGQWAEQHAQGKLSPKWVVVASTGNQGRAVVEWVKAVIDRAKASYPWLGEVLKVKVIADAGAKSHKLDIIRELGSEVITEIEGSRVGSFMHAENYADELAAASPNDVLEVRHGGRYEVGGYAAMAVEIPDQLLSEYGIDLAKLEDGQGVAFFPAGSGGLVAGGLELTARYPQVHVFAVSTRETGAMFDRSVRLKRLVRDATPAGDIATDGNVATSSKYALDRFRELGKDSLLFRDEDAVHMAAVLYRSHGQHVEATSALGIVPLSLDVDGRFDQVRVVVLPLTSQNVDPAFTGRVEALANDEAARTAYFKQRREEIKQAQEAVAPLHGSQRVRDVLTSYALGDLSRADTEEALRVSGLSNEDISSILVRINAAAPRS